MKSYWLVWGVFVLGLVIGKTMEEAGTALSMLLGFFGGLYSALVTYYILRWERK